jgi:hypothetical protein
MVFVRSSNAILTHMSVPVPCSRCRNLATAVATAREHDELSFAVGDIVVVTKRSADGWLYGTPANDQKCQSGGFAPSGKGGWLPSNYVRGE